MRSFINSLWCSSIAITMVKQWRHQVQDSIGGSLEVSLKQSRLQIPQDSPCLRKAISFIRCLLKQQTKGLTKLCPVLINPSQQEWADLLRVLLHATSQLCLMLRRHPMIHSQSWHMLNSSSGGEWWRSIGVFAKVPARFRGSSCSEGRSSPT